MSRSRVTLLFLVALAMAPSSALAKVRCVHGTVAPPPTCLTYPDLESAENDPTTTKLDEVRVYGTVAVPTTVTLRAAKLTGYSGGTLDGTGNPGVILKVSGTLTNVVIKTLTIKLSSDRQNQQAVGVEYSTTGIGKLLGVHMEGPPGGMGVGLDVLTTAGQVVWTGVPLPTYASSARGLKIGVRSFYPQHGRPSTDTVVMTDVQVGIQSTHSHAAQWFHTPITCNRRQTSASDPPSIGMLLIAQSGEDHNGGSKVDKNTGTYVGTISNCDVGIQIQCRDSDCGDGAEYDFLALNNNGVAVKAIQRDGTIVNDYTGDPTCGGEWGSSVKINGVPILGFISPCD